MKFILRPTVYGVMEEAAQWYEDQQEDSGADFSDRVLETFERIAQGPKLFPVIMRVTGGRQVRRALVDRFPYGVFYVLTADAIVVFALTHLQRDSREWIRKIPR